MRTRSPSALLVIVAIALAQYASVVSAELITIVEFYNTDLKHYVLITDPAEVAAIEQGAAGAGWERTGGSLMANSRQDDEPGLVPVCRFYGNVANGGPNSHFFTADPAECAQVKLDPGWRFEGIAFYVKLAASVSPAVARKAVVHSRTVYRAYNNGFRPQQGVNDGNHRFSTSQQAIQDLTTQGWTNEGPVFVVPGSTNPGAGLSGDCMIPKPGFEGTYVNPQSPVTQRIETSGTPASPLVKVTTEVSPITAVSTTQYQLTTPQNGRMVLSWDHTRNVITGPGISIDEDILMAQSLQLPMRPQEVQVNQGSISGFHTTTSMAGSCSSPIGGVYSTSYTFLGLQTVTVQAGTFGTCAFYYRQGMALNLECPLPQGRGYGFGGALDGTVLWFSEQIGLIGSGSSDPNSPGSELGDIIRLP